MGVRGLCKTKKGPYKWARTRNGKRLRADFTCDEPKAQEITAEINKMFDAGASLDEIRHRVLELLTATPAIEPHKPKSADIKPAMDWVTGAKL